LGTVVGGTFILNSGALKYREVNIERSSFKHQIAEVHATSIKRLSKVVAADDPSDGDVK